MSTTFEVYTPTKNIPTFSEVLSLSNQYLAEFLTRYDIFDKYTIDVEIVRCETNDRVAFDKSSPATWNMDDEYAWFSVNGISDGCDAYVSTNCDYYRMVSWYEEFKAREQAQKYEIDIINCLDIGFHWCFRRSVGQSCIINISYGLIAAAFSTLVNGFIFSDDGAWDYNMFPTTADDFLQKYFNPYYIKDDYASWARECIEYIKNYN